ncbi:hypothetical protein OHA21_00950 [Actinoplanes sp. NBC_00393]|uniref:hypothetical protein n=1 Tax=Actinoplanes sp. NBC_00393 TaxID=2975953 RepID=UPI002E23607A
MTEEEPELDRDAADPLAPSALIAAGSIAVASWEPPIPISVWRVPGTYPDPYELTPPVAASLIGFYTSPGDIVVSIGHDPALAGAAGAGGRTYRWVAGTDALNGLQHVTGMVSLIVLPWPPHEQRTGLSQERLVHMFGACRRLMRSDGCTIVALAATGSETYAEHTTPMLPAARLAGLGWSQHIVAITDQPDTPVAHRDADGALHMDFLVFAVHRSRHA